MTSEKLVKKAAEEKIKITYPIYAENRFGAIVVCFTAPKAGTVVVSDGRNQLMRHSTDWLPVTNNDIWRILGPDEVIELRNV